MSLVPQFHTFRQMVEVMSHNAPHALVQQEWARFERAVRQVCITYGASVPEMSCQPIAKLIDKYLVLHPHVAPELVRELHVMRTLRNQCAHGLAPPLTVEQATEFAYRAW